MRWEYKTIKLAAAGFWLGGEFDERALDTKMNDLGQDGWELATGFDTNQANGATRNVVIVFKRPSAN